MIGVRGRGGLRALAAAGLLGALMGATGAHACTGGASISGAYGMLVGGTTFKNGGKYLTGRLLFDGKCGITGSLAGGQDGGQSDFTGVTGTYGLNPDGVIAFTIQNAPGSTGPETFAVSYSTTGKEALGIETDGTAVASADLQFQGNHTYNTASLSGIYSTVCIGTGTAYSDLNRITFDGQGGLTGYDYYDDGGALGSAAPYSGSVAVNSQGLFGGPLNGGFSIFSFDGILDNNANEIQFVYFQSGAGTITMCTGKK